MPTRPDSRPDVTSTDPASPRPDRLLTLLLDDFRPLDALAPGLTENLARYVLAAEAAEALDQLRQLPGAGEALALTPLVHHRPYEFSRPASRTRLLERAGELEAQALVRLAEVYAAAFHRLPLDSNFDALKLPPWFEALVWEAASAAYDRFGAEAVEPSLLSVAQVAAVLRAEGLPEEVLYKAALPAIDPGQWPYPHTTREAKALTTMRLLGGLQGYGEALAHHPRIIEQALRRKGVDRQALVLRQLEILKVPLPDTLLATVVNVATTSKTTREAAGPLLLRAGPAALEALRSRAGSGSADERLHAVHLIARLDRKASRAFLHERYAADSSSRVRQVIEEYVGPPGSSPTAAGGQNLDLPPLPDVFEAVALGEETRVALQALVDRCIATLGDWKRSGSWPRALPRRPEPSAIQAALDRMASPKPWSRPAPASLDILRNAVPSHVEEFLARPELTPLHAVRFLVLAGWLRLDRRHAQQLCDPYDEVNPEKMLRAHHKARRPRYGLRELAAAFRASGLDDAVIGRSRLLTSGPGFFRWSDEATWPYFAEHLDLIEEAFTPSPRSRSRSWEDPNPADLRREALEILAAFPTPPPAFLPRLWSLALGSSRTDRLLAQRCLDREPDRDASILAALSGGKQEARLAAADWAARLRLAECVPALRAALAKEKTETVRSAFLNALEQLGGSVASRIDREALRSEAEVGLRKSPPKGLDWARLDQLPAVRWQDDDAPVDPAIPTWLLTQAHRRKDPAPTAMLRQTVAAFRSDDARRLGQFVLEAWISYDLRPIDELEAQKRGQATARLLASIDKTRSFDEHLATVLANARETPIGAAVADKGILAVAAACSPPGAGQAVRGYLDRWYGHRVHQCRALLQMLAWIEHPDAVQVLLSVARRFRTRTIRKEAEVQANALAERKGRSLDELADLCLPDAGFGADGRIVLDYGPRRFFARLDDQARVVLDGENGSRLASLPAPRKDDDPAAVEHAKAVLAEARTQLRAVLKLLTDRLHDGLCSQRAWTAADWRSCWLLHPIAGRLGRRLVWAAYDDHNRLAGTFRPMEDGTLTDLDDSEVRLEPGMTVRLAHTLTVPEAEVRRWVEHLADYEITPALPQFARPLHQLRDDQRLQTELVARCREASSLRSAYRTAKALGYDPLDSIYSEGFQSRYARHFPSMGLQAILEDRVEGDEGAGATYLKALWFVRSKDGANTSSSARKPVPLGQVPAVLLSECYADLLACAGGSIGIEAGESEAE